MPQVRILSSGPQKENRPLWAVLFLFSAAGMGLRHLANKARYLLWGSETTTACGGTRESSEWLRSIADDGLSRPRKISGTATVVEGSSGQTENCEHRKCEDSSTPQSKIAPLRMTHFWEVGKNAGEGYHPFRFGISGKR